MHSRQLIDLIGLQDNERLLLVGDETTDWIIDSLARFAQDIYFLEPGSRPLKEVPSDLQALLDEADVLLYVISKKGSDERAFRDGLNKSAESRGVRVANLLDVNEEIMQSAFDADVHEIKDFTMQLHDHMQSVRKVNVKTPAGSDFTVEFEEKYAWLASTGFVSFKKTRNAMPAEIFTHPSSVNGTIVVDGAYAALVGHEDSDQLLEDLRRHPLTWVVEDSRIVEVHCTNERIRELALQEIYEKDPENGNRIGEFGMGTNIGMTQLFGNVMHDEKFPGVHIAHGHGYPSSTGAEYDSSVHSDGVLLEVSVQDAETGEWIMNDGQYQL